MPPVSPAPCRPPATTFEHIEAWAVREPGRVALVQGAQAWSYSALLGDIVRVTRVLAARGVARGDRIAVGASSFQAGLVLLLAAENLGAVTTGFQARGDTDAPALFALVDWVASDVPQEVPTPARFIAIDQAFVREMQAASAEPGAGFPRVALGLHEPQRISRTSGSSGRSKFMLLTRQAQEHWVRSGLENGGYGRDTRLMVAGPLVMNAVFARSSACLRAGAAVLELGRRDLASSEVTHILALPALLEEIMASLPADFAPRHAIDVGTVGGFLSQPLREKAARLFGGRVASRYGANEVTGICDDLDAGGVGVVSAGVDIRIEDEQGRELPQGELGIIAVRTPGMVAGYLGDDEATARAFRYGWFVSGDWGTLVSHRVLRLAGRHDDLLNIGGIKVPAATVESQLRAIAGTECVALAVNLDGGAITLGIAIVEAGEVDCDAMRAKVARELRLGATLGAKVIFLDRVPRMDNGKVDRVRLHRLFASL